MKHPFFSSQILLTIILVFILSSCQKEEGPIVHKNHAPKIESLTANPDTLLISAKSTLTCVVIDEDNDDLTITWSSMRGAFPNGNVGATVIWIAPPTACIDTIHVSVSDGKQTIKQNMKIIVGTLPLILKQLKPVNGAVDVSLSALLVWNKIKNAQGYTVQVAIDNSFKKIILNKSNLKRITQKITGLTSNTVYYWRVRSENIFGKSVWSKIYSYRTVAPPNAPILATPVDTSKNVSIIPVLSWSALSNAASYTLQISSTDSFSDFIFDQSGIIDTSQQIAGLNYYTSYYWRVSATNFFGTSEWSKVSTFSTLGTEPQAPNLKEPFNGARGVSHIVTLSWAESVFASNYTLQVSDSIDFGNLIYNKSELTETSFTISGLSNTKTYYWRIKAANSFGASDWSEARLFTTLLSKPILSFPIDHAVDISPSPVLYWNSIAEAESYDMQISTDSLFSSLVYNETGLSNPSLQLSGLPSFTKYYWRVKANNNSGSSAWSNIQSFNVSAYFYKGLSYGSQAIYNPLYVILNGGFDMIQVNNKRDLTRFPLNIALKNIRKNLSDPFTPINNYGWWNFIKDQVIPLSLDKRNGQFWPNYTLHLVGGGMEYAALKEWYEYNNYPSPQLFSAFTVMSYHFINEVIENDRHVGDDVDPIADFYLFDVGGILLFTSENVKRFFSEDLNLADWSQQPSISSRNGELHNNGQFFSMRWKFPFSDAWHAFYYFGTNGVGGLSYKYKDGSAISFGMGLAAGDLILLDENKNKKTLGLVGNVAVFYDKNNSLLASLSYTVKTDYMINLNIYPGVVKLWGISPGLWAAYNDGGNVILGFTLTWLPIGLGHSLK